MPGVQRITVRGFKSIRELEALDLRPLNVLIGPNGGGKSNFIELFRMLESTSRGHLQSFAASHDGPNGLLYRGKEKQSGSIEVRLSFGALSYNCMLVPSGNNLAFQDEVIFEDVSLSQSMAIDHATPAMLEQPTIRVYTKSGHSESELSRSDVRDTNDLLIAAREALGGFRLFRFHDTLQTARTCDSYPLHDHKYLELDGKNFLSQLGYLSVAYPTHYQSIISTTRAACPFFGDFVFQQKSADDFDVRWHQMEDRDTLLSFRSLSSGTVRFIALATLLLQPSELQPQVILLDEPELGLHPLTLTLLGEMLLAASDDKQLIVATQSADLISEMQPESVIVVDRRVDESVFSRLKTSELADWIPDFSLGELWKTNLFGGCF